MNLDSILDGALDASSKGLPGPVTPRTARSKGWNLLRDDLTYPVMVLRDSALDHNLKLMGAWCAKNGFLLAPHGKTSMCPQLFKRQLHAGAWGITLATAQQVAVALRHGVSRILIANQLTGRANVRVVAEGLERAEISCVVDSVAGVDRLAADLAGAKRPLGVLLEMGRAGWRTGTRSFDESKAVLDAVLNHPGVLEFRGFEGYEGIAGMDEGGQVAEFLAGIAGWSDRLAATLPAPREPWLFSVGGTAYLDYQEQGLAPLRGRYRVVVRSGCHVTHDHGGYVRHRERAVARGAGAAFPDFRQALELWSVVQSVRDGATAILTFGRRDCPHDQDFPIPLFAVAPGGARRDARPLAGAKTVKLNDQHAYVALPPGVELKVGDRVACGISHPCTAFDKWAVVPLVDDGDAVIDLYCTRF